MKKPHCAWLFVHAYNDADSCVDNKGRPFTGMAGVRTALSNTMREMIAEDPDRNWNQCQWIADLHVHEGEKPEPDNLVGEFDLCLWSLQGETETLCAPEEQYICFAPGAVWHTDRAPGDVLALEDSHNPWVMLKPNGLNVTWLDRYSGTFEQFDIELRAIPAR